MTYEFQTVTVGDAIPSYTTRPITRTTLALFAGASGDHNKIHIDTDFAKKAGLDDVFAQGMLPMAYGLSGAGADGLGAANGDPHILLPVQRDYPCR